MIGPADRPAPQDGDEAPSSAARRCRQHCAMFDFSFVRRARAKPGSDVGALESFCDRPLADMPPGRIRYALRATPEGYLRSDLTVWRREDGGFDIMSGRPEDIDDVAAMPGVRLIGSDDRIGILAVQGPDTLAVLAPLETGAAIRALPYYGSCRTRIAGIDCLVGRLGYTGEAGVELICDRAALPELRALLSERCPKAGFAAIDILRIEAGFPLFWNDFLLPVTASEAGFARFASDTSAAVRDPLRRIALRVDGAAPVIAWRPRVPPRRPAAAGEVAITSVCDSPVAGGLLALGYARRADLDAGTALFDATGEFAALRRVGLPFYDPAKRRPREGWT